MDLNILGRAKEIQRQLTMLKSYVDNFPNLDTWDSVADLLDYDYNVYKKKALDTLNYRIAALEAEFKEL